jgi:hypothetical protein
MTALVNSESPVSVASSVSQGEGSPADAVVCHRHQKRTPSRDVPPGINPSSVATSAAAPGSKPVADADPPSAYKTVRTLPS